MRALSMLTQVAIKVPAIVAIPLLSAVAAMLLLSPAYGLREYASMVIWRSIAIGVIGGCMVAGSVVLRRSDDVHLRLRRYRPWAVLFSVTCCGSAKC